jgi:hypothetical protein
MFHLYSERGFYVGRYDSLTDAMDSIATYGQPWVFIPATHEPLTYNEWFNGDCRIVQK